MMDEQYNLRMVLTYNKKNPHSIDINNITIGQERHTYETRKSTFKQLGQ